MIFSRATAHAARRVCSLIRMNDLLNLIQASTLAWGHVRIFPFVCLAIFASTTGQCSREQRSGINRI